MEFKGTRGVWECIGIDGGRAIFTNGEIFMNMSFKSSLSESEIKANVQLVSESAKVRQQIPFSLTELKENYDELLKSAETVMHLKDLIKYPEDVEPQHVEEARAVHSMLSSIEQLLTKINDNE